MPRSASRTSALLVGGCLFVTLFAGCSGSGEPATPSATGGGTIGFVLLNETQEIFISQTKTAQDWADKNGYKLLVGDPHDDPLTQANLIDGWIDSQQIDGLFVGPIDVEALKPSLEKANKAGIPTIVASGLDQPANDNQTVLVVDWDEYGRQAGEALANCVNERFGGQGVVAILGGPELPGNIVTGRIDGEIEKIKELAPDSTVVAQQNGQGQRLPSLDVMSALLLKTPDINAVTGTNDDSMIGVVNAFKAAGKNPADACIVGLDATEEGLALVNSGDFYATVDLQPIQQILDGLEVLGDRMAGKTSDLAPDGRIVVATKIITKG